jgi:hypothetical protein
VSSGEAQEKRTEEKGFAGLSSMVSDVDATVVSASKHIAKAMDSTSQKSEQPNQSAHQERSRPPSQPSKPASSSSGGSSIGAWLVGIAVVFGLIWIVNQSDKKTPPRNTYSQEGRSTSAVPASVRPPPVVKPEAPSRPVEDKPPVGRNNVLSSAQIRYCVAEKIRIDAAEGVINNYVAADVDRFNGFVNDYNSRCGAFQYRQGALESARKAIEPYRSQLLAEGSSRFAPSPSVATRTPSPSTQQEQPRAVAPASAVTVRAIQRRLNELGYDAGPADGIPGKRTSAAIQVFQRENGLTVDGEASDALRRYMEALAETNGGQKSKLISGTPSKQLSPQSRKPENAWVSGSSWYCNSGYRKVGDKCEAIYVPANAWVSGSSWYCNNGYRKVSDKCEAIYVPANAWVSGSSWYCNNGYRKVGDKCEAISVPANAWVSGSSWYCNNGYRKVGDKCEAISVPANAWVSGSSWYCKDGYRKVGNNCVSIFE